MASKLAITIFHVVLILLCKTLLCCAFLQSYLKIKTLGGYRRHSAFQRVGSVPSLLVAAAGKQPGERKGFGNVNKGDRSCRLQELKQAVLEQNVTALQQMFHKKEKIKDMDWYVTKLLPLMTGGTLQSFWQDFVLADEEKARCLDVYTHTVAMSALNKHHRHDVAIETFEGIRFRGWELDLVAYVCAIRAAGYCMSFPYNLALLENAHAQLGNQSLAVAGGAIIGLKHLESPSRDRNTATGRGLMQRLWDILQWVQSKGMKPTSQIMDSAMAVACVHGSDSDCDKILQRMRESDVVPTVFTYNTLLDRHASRRNQKEAFVVIAQMAQAGIAADTTTYNTLLKLCVNRNDVDGAMKVVEKMKSTPDIAITDVAHSLLLRLMRNHPNHSTSLAELLSGNLEQAPSRFLLASQIESCQDAAAALALFQQALRQRSADEAVYVAVAKCLARCGDVPAAFAHIDLMLQGGMDLDKYSLSFLLRLCGETNDADRVVRYIRLCVRQYPQLLTRAVWNKVFSVLHSPSGGDAELAARLLTETLDAAPRCISHVHRVLVASAVRTLDAALQEELGNATATSSNGTARAKEIAATASDLLLSLCRALKQEGTSGRPLGSVVHPFAFNDVLRMLDAAGSADRVPSVFRAMSDEYNVSGGSESDQLLHPVENNNMLEWSEKAPNESGTVSLPAAAVKVWRPSVQQGQFRPSNYTITALVRNGRQRNDVGFIAEALRWSLERKVAIPFYAISDALSYLYSEGQRDLVSALYEELYRAGQVNHWAERPAGFLPVNAPSESAEAPTAVVQEGAATEPSASFTAVAAPAEDTATATVDNETAAAIATARRAGARVLDLHEFSRGMAYAAIKTAIAEVSSAEGSHVAGTELTVIAGQGVDRGTTTPATTATTAITATTADNAVGVDAAGSEHHDHHGDNDDDAVATAQRPFRLVETIQDMLIEEFHPPISSSTAPDNPGRVLIRL